MTRDLMQMGDRMLEWQSDTVQAIEIYIEYDLDVGGASSPIRTCLCFLEISLVSGNMQGRFGDFGFLPLSLEEIRQ